MRFSEKGVRKQPAFLLGFFALSCQVLLMREFAAHFYGNEMVFGVLLAAWLLWTGLGSILAARIRFTEQRFAYVFSAAILAFPLSLVTLRLSRFVLGLLPGEITGLAPAVLFALVLTSFICLPLGCLFVFNTRASAGKLSHVYLWEALGSSAAGGIIYFVLIPRLTNWQAAALLGGGAALTAFFCVDFRRQWLILTLSMAVMVGLWITDLPSQRLYWQPYDLVESRDSLYGKLQMLRAAEQVSLYSNGALIYSFPDPAAAEEAVHFALLQRPQAQAVLLIGGGVGGDLTQLLKYPVARIDYVEPDPEIIRFSRHYLPEAAARSLESSRVRILHADGRAFLNRAPAYDVIIVDLPDPTTAQLNRFYTQEFFRLAKQRLTPGGLFSFRINSAENYISPELGSFLASLYATLSSVFAEVEVVPGTTNIFLAAQTLDPLEHEALASRLASLGIENQYINPALLSARLDPLRRQQLADALQSAPPRLNQDLHPISYFYSAVLWSTKFRGLESRLFSTLAELDRSWLLDVPLAAFGLLLLVLGIKGNHSAFLLTPLAVMGWTTIVCEVIALLAFQIAHGSLYHSLALLFSSFMLGLSIGALRGTRRPGSRFSHIVLLQALFCLLLLGLQLGVKAAPPLPFFLLFLTLLGYLGGDLFVTANRLFLKQSENFGIGYGLDLLGSFLGALIASSLLIPIVGLIPLTQYLLLANSFCLLYLLWGLRRT
ncbi:MAG: fused MFS/spermidine synthase [Candidatus Aminicenantaceae bacterium]